MGNSRPPTLASRLRSGVIGLSGAAAGTFLVTMMLVTVVDVAGRYFLNMPLRGGFEMTQFLMAAIVFSGLPNVTLRDAHITIDLLDTITPERVIPWREMMVNAVSCAAFAVLAWRLWMLAGEAREWGDITQYLRWPRHPIVYFGATCCAVVSILHLGKLFAAGRSLFPARRLGA
jgi:TRAP-type C4-dicarboxylate transport system permease small subunit